MKTATYTHALSHDHHQQERQSVTLFGFWIYILTDCILFTALFATYGVLGQHTFGGPPAKTLFNLSDVFLETLALLTSSFTYGLAMLAMYKHSKTQLLFWLIITFLLGAAFISLELNEFHHLISTGNAWYRSAFLSAFFALVGTHGLHVLVGLIWMVMMMIQVSLDAVNPVTQRRLMCLSLFWHFLDIIWICVFTTVYLMGAL